MSRTATTTSIIKSHTWPITTTTTTTILFTLLLLLLNNTTLYSTLAFQTDAEFSQNNDTQSTSSKPVNFIKVHPKNITAIDRKAAFLICEAETDPKPTFTWFKDGAKISARRLPTIKYSKGTVLTIDPIKSGRDEGEYECQIENGYAPIVRSQIQVKIINAADAPIGFPKINTQPQSQTVQVGDVAIVNCLAQGDPQPEYSWFHDSVPVELPDTSGKRTIENGSLKIHNVTEDDKGIYHCMVINSKGIDTSSASNLMVSREPLPENPPIDLKYLLTSPTDVTITWLAPETKNNATISGYQVDFGKSGVLPKKIDLPKIERIAFNDLSENTEYAVRVRAKLLSGRLGSYSEAIRFTTPKDSPPPPSNVRALADSYNSAMVWWDETAYFSGIIGYRVYYSLYSDMINSSMYLEGLDRWLVKNVTLTNSVVISNLVESAQYEVRVCAVGINFSGKLSNSVRFNTSPDEVPRELQAIQLTTHSVKLVWKPPLELVPTRYKITYDAPEKTYFNEKMIKQTLSLSPKTLNTTATSISLDDLMPFTKYRINVTAVPSKEAFRPPAIIHITTAMAAPKKMSEPSTCNPINTRECEIFLSLASEEFSPVGHYYVVVVPGEMPTNDPDNYVTMELIERSRKLIDGVYIAAKFHKHKMPFKFVLGDNKSYDGFLNRPLDPDHQYRVFVRAYVEHSDTLYTNSDMSPPFSLSQQSKQVVQTLNNESFKNVRIVLMSALALVLALALIVTIFYKKQRQALKTNQINETTIRLLPEHMMDRIYSTVPVEPVERRFNNYQSRAMNKHPPVPISELADHIEVLKIGNNLKEEYESIEPGQQFTWEHSNMDYNRPKNRYGNVVSYDHNRVVLSEIDGIPGSDYINANFCDGYNRPNQYIATQGPLPNTVGDFWRMTWEQNSRTLVMMTQLEERGRVKCVQYWPSRDSVTYHGITITACDVEELAYYSIRTFKLQRGNEVREVKQFQFTAWPDHGVPDHPTPFLMFLRRIKVSNPPDSGPMIVLCSAGVGRTGCFIVIDSMIERIKHESTIDIYGHVTSLRAQRNYIVQTEDQYMFIHDAVLEAIIAAGTEVPVSKLGEHLHKMMQVIPSEGITNLELEFKRLASIRYTGQKFISANLPINKHKNRLMNILPYESTRVCLEPIAGVEGSDYINASFCDGYRQRNAYIATQSPLPDTVEDLWRMLIEHNSSIIIMLTKLKEGGREKCTQYWPAERFGDYGPYRISLNQEYDSTLNYILREFTITDSRSPNYSRVVRQFHYFNWPEQGVPKTGHAFINFIAEVHKTKDQFGIEGPITVHCSVGVGRTGVFIALSIVLERLREEGFLDLFETVRTLRTQRPGMVQTEDQYQFCYQTALEYVRSF